MTNEDLRNQFAIIALQELLRKTEITPKGPDLKYRCETAWSIADQMMKAKDRLYPTKDNMLERHQ